MLRHFDIVNHLSVVEQNGASHIQHALTSQALQDLREDVAQLSFSSGTSATDKVSQQFDRVAFRVKVPVRFSAIRKLHQLTGQLIRSTAKNFPQLECWQPHDIVIQRYSSQDFLSTHLDLRRHPKVIVIFTVEGSCTFEILCDRQGIVVQTFKPSAGDLLLLRAPGLTENMPHQGRPFHRVSGNQSRAPHRVSLTFRDNTQPDEPIPGLHFDYDN